MLVLCLSGTPYLLAGQGETVQPLYGSEGIRPGAVRQGALGSCYFHSVVAALAQSNPQELKKMIRENPDGTYAVQFADGRKETAYPEDIQYSRQSGYDLSDGLWVAALFRAYAQGVLRESLVKAVERSDLFPLVKHYAEDFIQTNDPVVLAYDRAIRSQVDQLGNIDREKLEARLKEELKPIEVSEDIKDSLVKLLESGGFFDSMAATIKANGEIFGAYRAVGQGGVAGRVMEAIGGSAEFVQNQSEGEAASALSRAASAQRPMVACTGGSRLYQQLAAHQPLPPEVRAWYINAHCYTVLGFNSADRTVKLRNPWGQAPDPDGVFEIPLESFVPAFRGLVTTGP